MKKGYVEVKPNNIFTDLAEQPVISSPSSITNKNLRDIMMIQSQELKTPQHKYQQSSDTNHGSIQINSNNCIALDVSLASVNRGSPLKEANSVREHQFSKMNSESQKKIRSQLSQVQEQAESERNEFQKQYDQLYAFSQQLQKEKQALLNMNSQLKDKPLHTQNLEKQIHHLQLSLQESEQTKSILQNQLDLNQVKFSQFVSSIETMQQNLQQITQIIQQFGKEFDLVFLGDSDELNLIVFTLEYLMSSYRERQTQANNYEQHIKETVQIIYDLQNKCNDLQDNAEKHNSWNSNGHPSTRELRDKIKRLKESGRNINLKWKEFYDNFLDESKQERQKHIVQLQNLYEELSTQKEIGEMLLNLMPKETISMVRSYLDKTLELKKVQSQLLQQGISGSEMVKNQYRQLIQLKEEIITKLNTQNKQHGDHQQLEQQNIQQLKFTVQNLQRDLLAAQSKQKDTEHAYSEMVALLKNDTQQKRLRIENAFMGKERSLFSSTL